MIWFAVFHPTAGGWAKVLRQRFCHVSLAGYANDTWVHLDVGRDGVEVNTIYAHDEVNGYLSFLLEYMVLVKVGHVDRPGKQFFRPMTCVSFVKHALGLRSGALLPDGLFRSLSLEHEVLDASTQTTGRSPDPAGAHSRPA